MTHPSFKNKVGIIIACIILAGAAILYSTKNASSKQPQQVTVIHAVGVKSIGVSLFLVADKMGYFSDQNIQMDINWMAGGDQVFKALTSKSADIGFVGLVPYGFVGSKFPSIKLVTVIADMNDTKIIANSDITTAIDLAGKKIGYSKSTASDIGLQKFLTENNIQTGDIEFINLSPAALPTAFAKGEIDAYAAREPNIYNGKKLMSGNFTVFDGEDQKYEWYFSLFADESYINGHHDAMKGVKNALQQAQKYIASHSSETKQLVSQFLNINTGALDSIWNDYTFHQSIEGKHTDALRDILNRAASTKGENSIVQDISSFIAQ